MKRARPNPLASRIKTLMRADEDVGKIAHATPVVIGRAVEIFLSHMVQGAATLAVDRGSKTLTPAHIKAHVMANSTLDFLKGIVASAPDLPPEGCEPPKEKRKRATGEGGLPKAASIKAKASYVADDAEPSSPHSPRGKPRKKGRTKYLPGEDSADEHLSEIDDDGCPAPTAKPALPPAVDTAAAVGPLPNAAPLPSSAEAANGGATPQGLLPSDGRPPPQGSEEAPKAPLPAVTAAAPPPLFALPSVLSAGPGALGARASLIAEEDDYD